MTVSQTQIQTRTWESWPAASLGGVMVRWGCQRRHPVEQRSACWSWVFSDGWQRCLLVQKQHREKWWRSCFTKQSETVRVKLWPAGTFRQNIVLSQSWSSWSLTAFFLLETQRAQANMLVSCSVFFSCFRCWPAERYMCLLTLAWRVPWWFECWQDFYFSSGCWCRNVSLNSLSDNEAAEDDSSVCEFDRKSDGEQVQEGKGVELHHVKAQRGFSRKASKDFLMIGK